MFEAICTNYLQLPDPNEIPDEDLWPQREGGFEPQNQTRSRLQPPMPVAAQGASGGTSGSQEHGVEHSPVSYHTKTSAARCPAVSIRHLYF